MRILFDLLMADDPVAAILGRVEVLSTDEDREVAGKTHWTLLLDTGKGPHTRRLLIDPHTKFLQRIEAVPRVGVAEHDSQPIVRWDAGTISTAPLPPDTFSPRPKGIAHEITMVDGKPLDRTDLARSRAREAELRGRFVGKPAPNFMLTVLDGEGSTRQVSKADLVGKVVLLDFWATWCGPCLKDLPHLQVLAARYARRDDLVIVALSEDEEPADRDELRTRIEETLTRSGVDLAGRRNSLVALDPTKVVGAAFEIYALPTVVLLDRQGIIRSIQVGMALPDPALPVTGDGVRIDLAKEIELLLAAAR